MKKITKDDILHLLQTRGELTLASIRDGVGAGNNSTVLHHLGMLVDQGKIRKTLRKTYKIVDIDGLPADRIETIRIPLIVAKAGPNDNNINETMSTGELPKMQMPYNTEDLIMVEVDGDSMKPTFMDGDLLLFQKQNNYIPKDKDIVLWRVDEGAKIKRFKWMVGEDGPYGLLLSDNLNYPDNTPIVVTDDNSSFIGKYLSVIKRKSEIT